MLECLSFLRITGYMTKALKHFQDILSEGIFISSLALLLAVISFATFFRIMQLPNLAEALPADSTSGYIVIETESYLSSVVEPSPMITDLLTYSVPAQKTEDEDGEGENELLTMDFGGSYIAFALIEGELVPMIDVASKSKVKDFMETAGIDDYMYVKGFLVMTPSQRVRSALESVKEGAQTVEETAEYANARGRLPYFSDAFAFVDMRATRMELVQLLGEFGYYEPGYFETILEIFPAAGVSIKMGQGQWEAELFISIDKEQLNGEGFYSSNSSYKHKLVDYSTGGYAFEWGGQDLANQLQRISEILAIRNTSAKVFFDGSLKEKFTDFFGSQISLEEIYSALHGEYYLGWTPGSSLMFMADIEDEDAQYQAQLLKDAFAANYTHLHKYESENGEVKANVVNLEGTTAEYEGVRYYRFGHGEETLIRLAITEELAVVSTSEAEFFATLDKIRTGQNLNQSSDTDKLFMGADEISALNLEIFSEDNILKSLLDNFDKILSSRKIFDDGVYSRYLITLRQVEENEQPDSGTN